MPAQSVTSATRAELDDCVALIALAFSSDPAARWLYEDANTYMAQFPRFIRAFGCAAFDYDTAHHLEGRAVALWIPPDAEPDEAALVALIQETVPAEDQEMIFAMFEQMGQAHPAEPHWYLPLIGTDPALQGRGLGSALLEHALALCDAQGVPTYLEATSPRNAALYERHGFEVTGAIQVGSSPSITPMMRKPR